MGYNMSNKFNKNLLNKWKKIGSNEDGSSDNMGNNFYWTQIGIDFLSSVNYTPLPKNGDKVKFDDITKLATSYADGDTNDLIVFGLQEKYFELNIDNYYWTQ